MLKEANSIFLALVPKCDNPSKIFLALLALCMEGMIYAVGAKEKTSFLVQQLLGKP